MSVIVIPSAHETFTPRELAAYKQFKEHGPQHQDAETSLSTSAYRFGERILLVYEELQTGCRPYSPNLVEEEFCELHLQDRA